MTKFLALNTIFLYLFISSVAPITARESGAKANIKALIPAKTDIRLFGYTAPNSIVQAQGIRTFAQTSSDQSGYFLINPLPVAYEAKEVCLTTIDALRRTGFPICYPIPDTDKPSEIGPILLSPTISLSKGKLVQKEIAQATGMTIPNSEVTISFFEIYNSSVTEKFAKVIAQVLNPTVEAADLPKIAGFSDKKGNFSINLPTQKAIAYRVFAKAFYKKLPTPKSQTLSFSIEEITKVWLSNTLPILLLFLFILIISIVLAIKERRDKWIENWAIALTEKRLEPFAVKTHLRLRRIWYNFREYFRSNRK